MVNHEGAPARHEALRPVRRDCSRWGFEDVRSRYPIGVWPQKRPCASSLSSADNRFGSCIAMRHTEGLGASDMGAPFSALFLESFFLLDLRTLVSFQLSVSKRTLSISCQPI